MEEVVDLLCWWLGGTLGARDEGGAIGADGAKMDLREPSPSCEADFARASGSFWSTLFLFFLLLLRFSSNSNKLTRFLGVSCPPPLPLRGTKSRLPPSAFTSEEVLGGVFWDKISRKLNFFLSFLELERVTGCGVDTGVEDGVGLHRLQTSSLEEMRSQTRQWVTISFLIRRCEDWFTLLRLPRWRRRIRQVTEGIWITKQHEQSRLET